MENKFDGYNRILDKYRNESRLRHIPEHRKSGNRIDLSTNDYLGLSRRENEFLTDFLRRCDASFTSSASRLLAGDQTHYHALESMLGGLYNKEALLFNSGYHANVGIISALNIPGTIFLTDKLIHASVIDGLSMSKAEKERWRHNDISHLRKLLMKNSPSFDRMIVVAESIYSMDGDVAPLGELIQLKKEFPSMILYLDEAHAFGVRGDRGLGLAEELQLIDEVDVLIGTFGKAGASAGAFVVTSPLLRSFLINEARSLIFSTAIPPVNIRWTIDMINRITKMKEERIHLAEISKDFTNFITEFTGIPNPSQSQIVPLMLGDAAKAMRVADELRAEGIDALAIRRPTVPPGGERIRFSLNASLSQKDMEHIKNCILSIPL